MNYHELIDNSILLIPDDALKQTQKALLAANKKGIYITTLERFISSFDGTPLSNWTIEYEAYQILKGVSDNFTFFKNTMTNSSFIRECLSFLEKMHTYHIDCEQLPQSNEIERELKQILSLLYALPTKTSQLYQKLKRCPSDLSHIYIDIQYPTLLEKKWIDFLVSHHAHLIHPSTNKVTYEYYHANNPRNEAEAIAQMILERHLSCDEVLIACCDSGMLSMVKSVMERYQIPVMSSFRQPSSLSYRCIALLEFALHPTYETFNECLIQKAFGEQKELLKAQKYYPYDYDQNYPEFSIDSMKTDTFQLSEIQQLNDLISIAYQKKAEIRNLCDRLVSFSSFSDLFLCVDEILRTYMDPCDHLTLKQIQNIFQDSLPYLKEKQDLKLCLLKMKEIRCVRQNQHLEGITLTTFKKMNHTLPITFIMQATQNHLTLFDSEKGIFDEDYAAKIPAFPNLVERFEYAANQLLEKLTHGTRIILSYPQNDYLGKAFESSLQIERLIPNESILLIPKRYSVHKEMIDNLSLSQANDLYVKNHNLKGSVSSLEKYVGCPYSYFLKYGCRIKEPLEEGFTIQKIGTLVHALFENLVKDYKKNYPLPVDLEDRIWLQLEDMKQVFPHLAYDYLYSRLYSSMKMNLEVLKDMEEHSYMTPTYCEKSWEMKLSIDNDTTLYLNGFIDRIDLSPTAFRILDYKSSIKKLDKQKVFSGEQLQLCTYLSVMNQQLNLRPLGAFYYSFGYPRMQLPYQKLNRRSKELEDLSDEKCKTEFYKLKRLQGWIFDDHVEIMDDNASHVNGITNTKKNGIHAKKVYQIDEIEDSMNRILRKIADMILSGYIQCEPNEAACLFCQYKPICRFHADFTEKKELVDYPPCMKEENKDEKTME